ncbi:MAG: polyprenyl synthetase family protein [Ruminococcaceae bacterium]|nr:polyprenyl synthetase family protein [Oscillospiraceae bacterium]
MLNNRTAEYTAFIEKYLQENCVNYSKIPQKTLIDAMRYSLLAGGKRLRPILVLDFCRMCGGDWQSAAPFAAALEMIHTYSLIHDDLPCMDNDDLRRGRPTNHKVYGEAMAVLAGDALLTEAFTMVASAPFDAETIIRAVTVLAECAGALGMVGGQVLDIQSETRECTEQEVLNIQERKTGALIKAACVLGVLAGGGTEEQIVWAGKFARHLGLAFQIRDDILDVIGTEEEMGKAVGTDAGKNTFVALHGLDICKGMVKSQTAAAMDCLFFFENNEYMLSLAQSLTDRTN